MSSTARAALAGGIAGGYLLGRCGKAKLALVVATYVVSKKLQAKPQDLLAAGASKLGESPQLADLGEQVRGEVLSVGREAVKAAVDRRLGAFADSLADRTKSLSETLEEAEEASRDTTSEGSGGTSSGGKAQKKAPQKKTAQKKTAGTKSSGAKGTAKSTGEAAASSSARSRGRR
ncbi:hypothetical protein [Streptomyces sp. HNM0574]|uniref:hypothetical protein n=1 Tax=Streptomyces sp. HNM0574 TaxID=2714954 RepID=UPI00146BB3C5|nr:hypothetical protein [Streptomyces sp. HNM0574]NLU70724.1 hypothetical protein [Streptomyces sp. HNM0574]